STSIRRRWRRCPTTTSSGVRLTTARSVGCGRPIRPKHLIPRVARNMWARRHPLFRHHVAMASVDRILESARARIGPRVSAEELSLALAGGALVVDIRPRELRDRDGALDGATVVDRNVLEWRLDATCPHRLEAMDDPGRRVIIVCDEGYASSLA